MSAPSAEVPTNHWAGSHAFNGQGLSQDLETDSQKLAIATFLGVIPFRSFQWDFVISSCNGDYVEENIFIHFLKFESFINSSKQWVPQCVTL